MSASKDALFSAVIGFLCSILIFSGSAYANSISVMWLSAPPTINGNGDDWDTQHSAEIPLKNIHPESQIKADSVTVNAGIYEENIYFYLVWDDATEDLAHKSWRWSEEKNKYIRDSDREDRMAMQFELSGDYTTDWFSGKEFRADMWHWKSSRTNPLRLAHDKSTVVSKQKLLHAYQHVNEAGEKIFLQRPSDSGTKLYSSKRYHAKQGERAPKYILNNNAEGSVTDIEAQGKWIDGKWHLELRRALNTGDDADVVFIPGTSVKGGIAIFDHSDNDDHAISETLIFNLADRESAELTVK